MSVRLGISGTYSSGKTLTALALAHYTGIPRTRAKTMREILPDAAPGKTLEECSAAELLQMIVVRHTERVLHETVLAPTGFVSDGSSLQEWIYGSVRVRVGINPNASAHLAESERVEKTAELVFFEDVMEQLGRAMKRHVKASFEAFVHLRNELPLAADGHRPVNEHFRRTCDGLLVATLDELAIPYHVVGGSIAERLQTICRLFDLVPVMSLGAALDLAERDYAGQDMRDELSRGGTAAVLASGGKR